MIAGSIVLYKTEISMVSEVINSFFRGDARGRLLYLVDNSPTNELESLKELYPNNIEYIFCHANHGYGKAHNIAIKKSIENGFEYHVVLNPDLSFNGDTLSILESFMNENQHVGLCTPDIFDYNDGRRRRALKLLPTPLNAFLRGFLHNNRLIKRMNDRYTLSFADYTKVLEAPYLSGCFMFFRNKYLQEIDLFDEKIFMYYEDTDISRRMFRKYSVCCVPSATAKHISANATHKSIKMFCITIKSAIYYFCKYGWFFDNERRQFNNKVLKNVPRK